MKLFLVASLMLALGLVSVALAEPLDGVNLGTPGTPITTSPPTRDYVEGWNDTQPYQSAGTYGADCFGYAYTPSVNYLLEKIEFYAGGASGEVTVAVRGSDGSGLPTGPILGQVTYVESAIHGWQGANLLTPVQVTAGQTYYIQYAVVVGADVSTAATGTIIGHAPSSDHCASWNGWWFNFPWMARFYGQSGGTPASTTSWGVIKSIYR
jgi:hypothetical protein